MNKSIYTQYLCLAFMASNHVDNKITDDQRKQDYGAKAAALRDSEAWDPKEFKTFLKESGLKTEKNFDSEAGLNFGLKYIQDQPKPARPQGIPNPKFVKTTGPLVDREAIKRATVKQLFPVAKEILNRLHEIGLFQNESSNGEIPIERPFQFLFGGDNGISNETFLSIYDAAIVHYDKKYPVEAEDLSRNGSN